MATEGGDAAAPLTRADIPDLVKAVAEALVKPPGDPGSSGGSCSYSGYSVLVEGCIKYTHLAAKRRPRKQHDL
jgi:hypothetical protein